MKFMRLAMCVAAFAVIGKVALSEDVDVRALQAKLAAQEARLADLQSRVNYNEANANYGGAPEAIVSLNKNACVTIGGTLNTRYFYRNAKIDSYMPNADFGDVWDGQYTRRAKVDQGDLTIADAKVYVKVDVNEYFEAFVHMNLQDSGNSASDNAEEYYIRWKNICNSGFGVLVGRTGLAFGEGAHDIGILGSYVKNGDGALSNSQWGSYAPGANTRRATWGNFVPAHNYWDQTRITQITPYWEGLDGKLKAEISFFQNNSNVQNRMSNGSWSGSDPIYYNGRTYKSNNYGVGSMSARIAFMPIEGLKITGSVINFYNKSANDWALGGKKNNTAVNASVSYRPAFFNRVMVWVDYMHGWNVYNLDDLNSDAINYGVAFDLNESWSVFLQGDYLRTKDKLLDTKDTLWAVYGGIKYVLPYGVNVEAGWKHENVKWKNSGHRILKGKGDMAYVHLGFDF